LRRREARWTTPFGRWIDAYGVDRVASQLRAMGEPVSVTAVYLWIAGTTIPRLTIARKLEQLGQGAITLDQIYDHRELVRAAGEEVPSAD
jgi:hypothetical protein